MATLAIFGTTGKTGSRALTRALEAGHTVRALVRDPAKLPIIHDGLTLIQGDVLDPLAVAETVQGADAVLALFGQVKGSPNDLQARGTRNIVSAMQQHGVRRLITLSGGGLRAAEDRPKVADRVIRSMLKLMAGHVLRDAEEHLKVLTESGLDWTVVRGPMLTEAPGKGAYRVGWVGVDASTRISRDDLADFILVQVEDRRFVHQMPFVSD